MNTTLPQELKAQDFKLALGIEIVAAMKASCHNWNMEEGRIDALTNTAIDRHLTDEEYAKMDFEDKERAKAYVDFERDRLHKQALFAANAALSFIAQQEPVGYCHKGGGYSSVYSKAEIEELNWNMESMVPVYAHPLPSEHLQNRIAELENAIRIEQSGLAKALEKITQTANSYSWIQEGRGPYSFDDEAYKSETYRCLTEIVKIVSAALHKAGKDATAILHRAINKPTEQPPLSRKTEEEAAIGFATWILNSTWQPQYTCWVNTHKRSGQECNTAELFELYQQSLKTS